MINALATTQKIARTQSKKKTNNKIEHSRNSDSTTSAILIYRTIING